MMASSGSSVPNPGPSLPAATGTLGAPSVRTSPPALNLMAGSSSNATAQHVGGHGGLHGGHGALAANTRQVHAKSMPSSPPPSPYANRTIIAPPPRSSVMPPFYLPELETVTSPTSTLAHLPPGPALVRPIAPKAAAAMRSAGVTPPYSIPSRPFAAAIAPASVTAASNKDKPNNNKAAPNPSVRYGLPHAAALEKHARSILDDAASSPPIQSFTHLTGGVHTTSLHNAAVPGGLGRKSKRGSSQNLVGLATLSETAPSSPQAPSRAGAGHHSEQGWYQPYLAPTGSGSHGHIHSHLAGTSRAGLAPHSSHSHGHTPGTRSGHHSGAHSGHHTPKSGYHTPSSVSYHNHHHHHMSYHPHGSTLMNGMTAAPGHGLATAAVGHAARLAENMLLLDALEAITRDRQAQIDEALEHVEESGSEAGEDSPRKAQRAQRAQRDAQQAQHDLREDEASGDVRLASAAAASDGLPPSMHSAASDKENQSPAGLTNASAGTSQTKDMPKDDEVRQLQQELLHTRAQVAEAQAELGRLRAAAANSKLGSQPLGELGGMAQPNHNTEQAAAAAASSSQQMQGEGKPAVEKPGAPAGTPTVTTRGGSVADAPASASDYDLLFPQQPLIRIASARQSPRLHPMSTANHDLSSVGSADVAPTLSQHTPAVLQQAAAAVAAAAAFADQHEDEIASEVSEDLRHCRDLLADILGPPTPGATPLPPPLSSPTPAQPPASAITSAFAATATAAPAPASAPAPPAISNKEGASNQALKAGSIKRQRQEIVASVNPPAEREGSAASLRDSHMAASALSQGLPAATTPSSAPTSRTESTTMLGTGAYVMRTGSGGPLSSRPRGKPPAKSMPAAAQPGQPLPLSHTRGLPHSHSFSFLPQLSPEVGEDLGGATASWPANRPPAAGSRLAGARSGREGADDVPGYGSALSRFANMAGVGDELAHEASLSSSVSSSFDLNMTELSTAEEAQGQSTPGTSPQTGMPAGRDTISPTSNASAGMSEADAPSSADSLQTVPYLGGLAGVVTKDRSQLQQLDATAAVAMVGAGQDPLTNIQAMLIMLQEQMAQMQGQLQAATAAVQDMRQMQSETFQRLDRLEQHKQA